MDGAIGGLLTAIFIFVAGNSAMKQVYATVKTTALTRVQQGQPRLSAFTAKLTCATIDKNGNFVPSQTKSCKRK